MMQFYVCLVTEIEMNLLSFFMESLSSNADIVFPV